MSLLEPVFLIQIKIKLTIKNNLNKNLNIYGNLSKNIKEHPILIKYLKLLLPYFSFKAPHTVE